MRLQENRRDIHHEESEVGSVGDSLLGDVHEVFQSPELPGIAEVKLDLKAQTVVIGELSGGQCRVDAEEDGMGAFASATDDLIALAQSRLTRTLTDDECHRYLHVETCPA